MLSLRGENTLGVGLGRSRSGRVDRQERRKGAALRLKLIWERGRRDALGWGNDLEGANALGVY